MSKVAQDLEISLAKLAIAWCLKNDNVSTVILGASKSHQLEETLTAINEVDKLTEEVMERIEGILVNRPVHPDF